MFGAGRLAKSAAWVLGAGGKPSTWLPPGKLADLLNNSTIHVLCPHAHVIFWCVPRIPHARGDIQTLCNILSHSLVLPIAAFLEPLVILPLMHAVITCTICYSTCVASSSGVYSTLPMHRVLPTRSRDTSPGVCVASHCCAAAFLGCLVIFLSFHATITCAV